MYKVIEHSDNDAGIKEIVVDTLAEMPALPCSMASVALCLEDMKYYIKDGQGNWRELA